MDEIKFDKRNYRLHNDENKRVIKKSLKELGAGRSIVIDKDGEIIAGNGVYEQAKKLGIKTKIVETDGSELVVVKRTDLATGDDKRKKLALADNAASDTSEWADDLLREDWTPEVLADFGVVLPEVEMPTETEEAQEDDFDEEKDKVETVCKNGDIWQLGEHRLMCGDSTKPEDVQRLMQGELADLFLTDPPYNVDYEGSDGQKIKNDKMGDSAFLNFLTDAFTAANNVLRPGCAIYIWHADSEGYNFRSAFKAAGWTLRQCLIWVKNSLVIGRQDYQWKHEPCLYGWKDGAAHYFTNSRSETTTIEDEGLNFEKMEKDQLVQLLKDIYSDKVETTVIHENKPARNAEHPTMKPIRLLARLIRNSSRQGQNVLDTFGGSGSTLIACEQMNRTCYTMELDPHYCDVIIARWEKLTGQKANKTK